jgi:hypothetical protein
MKMQNSFGKGISFPNGESVVIHEPHTRAKVAQKYMNWKFQNLFGQYLFDSSFFSGINKYTYKATNISCLEGCPLGV